VCGDDHDRRTALRTHRIARIIDARDQRTLISELETIERAVRKGSVLPYPEHPIGRRCRVRVGVFKGVDGTVVRIGGRTHLVLQIDVIGMGAALQIDADFLEFLPEVEEVRVAV
jgi:hypothetical protein